MTKQELTELRQQFNANFADKIRVETAAQLAELNEKMQQLLELLRERGD